MMQREVTSPQRNRAAYFSWKSRVPTRLPRDAGFYTDWAAQARPSLQQGVCTNLPIRARVVCD